MAEDTETGGPARGADGKFVGKETSSEPEFIQSIIYELDNGMFLLALGAGIVVGGFLLWAYLNRDKFAQQVETSPEPVLTIIDGKDKEEEVEAEEEVDYGNVTEPEQPSFPSFTYSSPIIPETQF